ncbi:hypothetical protein SDC9_127039 [bioreactor metagenome]|uniref:Uncharacterized protein n=1 Tax=bioreactor metagenome TaxID=1076179 RepID=A0A645CSA8_9ZZZZ
MWDGRTDAGRAGRVADLNFHVGRAACSRCRLCLFQRVAHLVGGDGAGRHVAGDGGRHGRGGSRAGDGGGRGGGCAAAATACCGTTRVGRCCGGEDGSNNT